MKENDLPKSIANLYAKFFDEEKKKNPNCQCGNIINTKTLKMGLEIINYGICNKCNKITYFKEFNEFNKGTYTQVWQMLNSEKVKIKLEQYLDTLIPDIIIKIYSPGFDVIITKIYEEENLKKLTKVSFRKEFQ